MFTEDRLPATTGAEVSVPTSCLGKPSSKGTAPLNLGHRCFRSLSNVLQFKFPNILLIMYSDDMENGESLMGHLLIAASGSHGSIIQPYRVCKIGMIMTCVYPLLLRGSASI